MTTVKRSSTLGVSRRAVLPGANPDGTDWSGQTALLYPVLFGSPDFGSPDQTQALTENGADGNQVMKPNWNSPTSG